VAALVAGRQAAGMAGLRCAERKTYFTRFCCNGWRLVAGHLLPAEPGGRKGSVANFPDRQACVNQERNWVYLASE
jgi:hypothetical protein